MKKVESQQSRVESPERNKHPDRPTLDPRLSTLNCRPALHQSVQAQRRNETEQRDDRLDAEYARGADAIGQGAREHQPRAAADAEADRAVERLTTGAALR